MRGADRTGMAQKNGGEIMEQIIAQIVGGLIGGGAGGKMVPGANMGNLGNLLAGGVGGLAGGQVLGALMGAGGGAAAAAGGVDIAALAGLPVPICASALAQFKAASAAGLGHEDDAAITKYCARQGGIKLPEND